MDEGEAELESGAAADAGAVDAAAAPGETAAAATAGADEELLDDNPLEPAAGEGAASKQSCCEKTGSSEPELGEHTSTATYPFILDGFRHLGRHLGELRNWQTSRE